MQNSTNFLHRVTPAELEEHFYSKCGAKIFCVRLLVKKKSGTPLGWGFLEFENKLEYEVSVFKAIVDVFYK